MFIMLLFEGVFYKLFVFLSSVFSFFFFGISLWEFTFHLEKGLSVLVSVFHSLYFVPDGILVI